MCVHCYYTLELRETEQLKSDVEVYDCGGRSKLGQENVRGLQPEQLQLHIRGCVIIGKVKRSADDLELLQMRTYIIETRRKFTP